MKTSIYIEDGVVQLVLTPESVFEKNAIRSFEEKPTKTEIFSGTFYDCRGGWVRQKDFLGFQLGNGSQDRSLILRIVNESTSNNEVRGGPSGPSQRNEVERT